MAIGGILTQGLGSFGSVNRMPTLGFYIGEAAPANFIKLSVTGFLLNRKTISGNIRNRITLAGILRYE